MKFYPMVPLALILVIVFTAVTLIIFCIIKKKWRKTKNFRRIAMIALMALTLARPVFTNASAFKENSNLNLFFVVDATASMATRDGSNKEYRYFRATKDIKKIVELFPSARYSLIIEDNTIYTAAPLSSNADMIMSSSSVIHPKASVYSAGTNTNKLLAYAGEVIANYAKDNPSRVNIVFYFGDGGNTAEERVQISNALRSTISNGAVFGYGSEKGDIIENYTTKGIFSGCIGYSGSDKDIVTDDKHCVISKINEDNLKTIANGLGINYYHRESDESIPEELVQSIRSKAKYSDTGEKTSSFTDTYWIFSMAIIVLMIWDFYDILGRVTKEREVKHVRP